MSAAGRARTPTTSLTSTTPGIDINDGYIADARRRHRRDFRVADVTRFTPGTIEPADMVLVNSLLHHLDDEETHRTLSSLPPLVTADGMVHILDLVLPDALSPAALLAKLDCGRYPRRVDDWREHFLLRISTEADFRAVHVCRTLGDGLFSRQREDVTQLSIAIPVFNEEAVVPELLQRVRACSPRFQAALTSCSLSTMAAAIERCRCSRRPPKTIRGFRIVVLVSETSATRPRSARRWHTCSGDAIVLMDGDLQDVPEAIPSFIHRYRAVV